MLAALVGLGRRTVTGMLHTCGAGFQDWSAVYRLFSKARLDADSLFAVTRRGVVRELDPAGEVDRMEMLPLCTARPGMEWNSGSAVEYRAPDPHLREHVQCVGRYTRPSRHCAALGTRGRRLTGRGSRTE